MALEKLSHIEQTTILECLTAVAEGPFIDEIDFQTLLGYDQEALRDVIKSFPDIDDCSDTSPASLLINNCLNEICNGVPISEMQWQKWFTVTKKQFREVYQKWARLKGYHTTGIK